MARTRKTARISQHAYIPQIQKRKFAYDNPRNIWKLNANLYLVKTLRAFHLIDAKNFKTIRIVDEYD